MNTKELETIKATLEKQLHQLRSSLGAKDRRPLEESALSDINDQATLESERNFELNIKDRERTLVRDVEEALQRISEGTYGICQSCDEPINVKRLFARPTASYCIACQAEIEAEERSEDPRTEAPAELSY